MRQLFFKSLTGDLAWDEENQTAKYAPEKWDLLNKIIFI